QRPDHDRHYPDIAVPLELAPSVAIAANQSQLIWVDVDVPPNAPAGIYSSTINVSSAGTIIAAIPVTLTVRNFTLPAQPTAKTMVDLGYSDINLRYVGQQYPNPGTASDLTSQLVRNR